MGHPGEAIATDAGRIPDGGIPPARAVAAAFLLAALFVLHAPAAAGSLAVGDHPPPFALPNLEGYTVELSHYRGKPVVIAFFSTQCSRCMEEIRFLKREFGSDPDVVVLLVNQDSEARAASSKIREIQRTLDIAFPILFDERLELMEKYGIKSLPTTVVVGKDGKIALLENNFYSSTPERIIEAVRRK